MTGVCLFACVVRLGFDSMREDQSQPRGRERRPACQKTESGSYLCGQGCVDIIYIDVCGIPTSCKWCLFGTVEDSSLIATIIMVSSISIR